MQTFGKVVGLLAMVAAAWLCLCVVRSPAPSVRTPRGQGETLELQAPPHDDSPAPNIVPHVTESEESADECSFSDVYAYGVPSRNLTGRWMPRVDLPFATSSVQDKANDPDDRILLTIDEQGWLTWGADPMDAAALASRFARKRDAYNKKMKLRGKRGFETGNDGRRWSKLFLLIRMGRNTPWEHVVWLTALARKEQIYKIQLATSYRKEPLPIDSPYFHPEPVEFPCTTLEGKLALFSSTRDQPDKIRRHVHVAAVAWAMRDWATRDGQVLAFVESATNVVYRFGGFIESDPEAIRKWLAGMPEPNEDAPWPTPVALTVDPRVPTRFVVAAIDRIKKAGFVKLDLLDHVAAPESRFRSPQVPYPRR